MYHLRFSFLLFLGFLYSNNSKAQLPSVDLLYIRPTHPTPSDSISIIYKMTYSSTLGQGLQYDYQPLGNTIELKVCHGAGFGAAITSFRDTVVVPPLGLGLYQLNFELQRGTPDSMGNCIFFGWVATGYDTLNFEVTSTTNNPHTILNDHTIFPNPVGAGQPLRIEVSTPMTYVACYNSTGILVEEQQLSNQYSTTIPLEQQPTGLYYVVIQTTTGRRTQKVIKQ